MLFKEKLRIFSDKHKLAADHIKQQTERNLANCKQKKETIDFEIQLLKRIKEEYLFMILILIVKTNIYVNFFFFARV